MKIEDSSKQKRPFIISFFANFLTAIILFLLTGFGLYAVIWLYKALVELWFR